MARTKGLGINITELLGFLTETSVRLWIQIEETLLSLEDISASQLLAKLATVEIETTWCNPAIRCHIYAFSTTGNAPTNTYSREIGLKAPCQPFQGFALHWIKRNEYIKGVVSRKDNEAREKEASMMLLRKTLGIIINSAFVLFLSFFYKEIAIRPTLWL